MIAMLIDLVSDARAGSVVVASSAPRTDILDACDCKAAISAETVVFSHRLRMLTRPCSTFASVSIPPFSMA